MNTLAPAGRSTAAPESPCFASDASAALVAALLYVQSNPLVYVDPTGELLVFAGSKANLEKLRKIVNDSLHGYELFINKNGTVAAAVPSLCILVILNPFNLLVEKSSRFSYHSFERVSRGMSVNELVILLGRPVQVKPLGRDYWRCPNCSAYCFMGNPPAWLKFYREAWVYVGPDNMVREKFLNTQP